MTAPAMGARIAALKGAGDTGIGGPRELGAGEGIHRKMGRGGQATDALIALCPPQGRKRVHPRLRVRMASRKTGHGNLETR